MDSLERYLAKRLRLRINRKKSAVARPWKRQFLGYSVTSNREPRLKIAPKAIKRLKKKLRPLFRRARGNNLTTTVKILNSKLQGWIAYYRLSDVTGVLKQLDSWIRRKLRVVVWRHWKRPRTRFEKLMERGVNRHKAARAAWGKDGPWQSAAGSAMNVAVPNKDLRGIGLLSLVDKHRLLASL